MSISDVYTSIYKILAIISYLICSSTLEFAPPVSFQTRNIKAIEEAVKYFS